MIGTPKAFIADDQLRNYPVSAFARPARGARRIKLSYPIFRGVEQGPNCGLVRPRKPANAIRQPLPKSQPRAVRSAS